MINKTKPRCSWCNPKNPLYIAYHDNEWGLFPEDEQQLYELFILETFQAGLSWECVLNKRENFRRAFDGFDIDKVCEYGEEKLNELMQDAGIIRNRRKIRASVKNSRIYRKITIEFGSFEAYIKNFTRGRITVEPDPEIKTSQLSDAISKDLKRRGMTFVGSVTIYSFLQATGVVRAHQEGCFCYKKLLR